MIWCDYSIQSICCTVNYNLCSKPDLDDPAPIKVWQNILVILKSLE